MTKRLIFLSYFVGRDDIFAYKYNSSIIIKNMVTKSPIRLKEHKITIEKLIVDIVCDNLLNQFYEGAEKQHMIKEIFDKYAVKYDSIKNYVKRRNALMN